MASDDKGIVGAAGSMLSAMVTVFIMGLSALMVAVGSVFCAYNVWVNLFGGAFNFAR